MRFNRFLGAAAVVTGVMLGACDAFDLAVNNTNAPDRGRIFKTPAEVQNLASSQFQQIISGTIGSITRTHIGMLTASFENASGLANNGLGPRGGIPRQPIDNSPGNAYSAENYADFRILTGVARNAADIIARASAEDFDLAGGAPDVDRLKSWAFFVYGVSLGYLSLVYDSAGVPRPTDGPADIPPLEGYMDVNAEAIAAFDSALAYASKAGVPALPGQWLKGPNASDVSMSEFQRIIRSFRARMRAGVARNPTERAAVDWNAVIADATNGIQSDFMINMNPSQGWDYAWLATTLHFRDVNWHQMTPYIIGMADVSGAYDNWLATPRDQRTPFTIVTPDKRFPQGSTRAEQQRPADDDDKPLPAGQYFRNRNSGKDNAALGWQNSQYDHYRHRGWADASRIGAFPFFTVAENDMLAAEGYIRTGQIAQAAQLIDKTRVKNGLPALTGAVASANDPVPGGNQCVPRVPDPAAGYKATKCGDIMEAMKWEKRMETAYTTYGAWFFDSRGWGDLPEGTAVHWPVPFQEANARRMTPYNFGGIGGQGAAGPSTYGFGSGSDL